MGPPPRGSRRARLIILCLAVAVVPPCALGIAGVLRIGDRAVREATTASHAGLGQPARDGKFAFLVTGITCGRSTEGDGQMVVKSARGQFCEVGLNVRNIGNRSQVFTGAWQKARISNGDVVGDDTEAAIYANSRNRTFIQQIGPGGQAQGMVVFDIPRNAKIVSLELHDSVLSAGVIVTID